MKHASRTSKHASRTSPGFSDSKKSIFRNEKESVVKARLLFLATILAFQVVSPNISHVYAADRSGVASVYSTDSGSGTASGQKLNPNALTAAHRTLPFGTKVRVTNKRNGRSVIVTVNDRGPFIRGRIIDVTPAAARALGFSGLAQVSLNVDG
jgi:peptidoglycan lytic transglycosylase